MLVSFESLPDHARIWIFGASRPLVPSEATRLVEHVDSHIRQWAAHGAPITGARRLVDDSLLVIAADDGGDASGCSIDRLFRTLSEVEGEIDVSFLDSTLVFYRDADNSVRAVSRTVFRELAAKGDITEETVVFDNSIETLGDFRQGEWEKPASRSWHARAFGIVERATVG